MSILADAHADAPILVEAEEHVAEPTRHHVHQREVFCSRDTEPMACRICVSITTISRE